MNASINLKTLKAVSLAASKDKIRHYLNGVFVEITAETIRYTATDGHILISRTEDSAEPNTLIGSWIIPAEFVKSVKLIKRTDHATLAQGSDTMMVVTGCFSGLFYPIDGTFPSYRAVIPQAASGEPAQFDGFLLGRIADFADKLGLGRPRIHYNGAGPAPVTFSAGNGIAVVMPLRISEAVYCFDDTLLSPTEAASKNKGT
jgi:hypothetical protein